MPSHPRWTVPDARSVLETAGFDVLAVERTRDDFGTVLRCSDGALVSVYDTGRVLCQGRRISETKALFSMAPAGPGTRTEAFAVPAAALPATSVPKPSAPATPTPAPSTGSVRFVRDVPGPDATDDRPW